MKVHLLLCLLALALIGAAAEAGAGSDDLEAAIRDGNNAWIAGMKSGDPERATAPYAADVLDCGPKGDCVNGREAVVAKFKARFAKSGAAKSASVRSAGHTRDGEFAYEWGAADFTDADGKTYTGRFLTVWRHEPDGSWKICRNIVLPK
jgi:ketosteroid isomerase-like protein